MAVIHIEGVNFQHTLFDTNDLSTIRGSSMLLENLAKFVEPRNLIQRKLIQGASKLVFETDTDEIALSELRAAFEADDNYRHFSLVYGYGQDARAANAMARQMQYKQWCVPTPEPDEASTLLSEFAVDPLDLTRAATVEDHGPDGRKRRLSASVKARREFGKKSRPFAEALQQRCPFMFDDLVSNTEGVPEKISNKMAVIKIDAMGAGVALQGADADEMNKAARRFYGELANVLEPKYWRNSVDHSRYAQGEVVRFDTLVFGGDDMLFVLPAWLLCDFVQFFWENLSIWEINGTQLNFRIGAIIAGVKSPIRLLSALAESSEGEISALVKDAKKEDFTALRSYVSIDVLEGAELPHDSVSCFRNAFCGTNAKPEDFVLPLDKFSDWTADIRSIGIDENVPTLSRLHNLFREQRAANKTLYCDAEIPTSCDKLISPYGKAPLPLLAQMVQLKPYIDTSFKLIGAQAEGSDAAI